MRFVLAWLLLLLLLGAELVLTFVLRAGGYATALGPVMAAVVAVGLLRVRQGPALARICAVAGLVWLAVLLALGTLDPATRTVHPLTDATPD